MKKEYTYGEMLLVLRNEYKKCRKILTELNKCVSIQQAEGFYFDATLTDDYQKAYTIDRRIVLIAEKEYPEILKKFKHLKYGYDSNYLYTSVFDAEKQENDLYKLKYDNHFTSVEGKKYIPNVFVRNEKEFSKLVEQLFATDLMNLNHVYISNNNNSIVLDFSSGYIHSNLGENSYIIWNGITNTFEYEIYKNQSPEMIGNILSLSCTADSLSPEWLQLLEKYEKTKLANPSFNVDSNIKSKKGKLKVKSINDEGVTNLVLK